MVSTSRHPPQKRTAEAGTSAAAAAYYSRHDVGVSDVNSDKDAPIQQPQASTGAARLDCF